MTRTKASKVQSVKLPSRFEARFWEQADQRVGTVKTIKRRIERLRSDAGADSFQRDMLCQRAIFIATQLESMEVEAIESGNKFEPGVYTQMVNALSGLLTKLGLEKKGRKRIGLNTYLEEKAG